MTWEPERYLTYADERARPLDDLVGRVGAADPRLVVDLGCGPATLTKSLARRWPRARVIGVDSSAEMLAAAPPDVTDAGVELVHADLREWSPPDPVDVVVANATLQWVPGHLDLLPTLVSWLRPGAWLAFQVPGNFDSPSHTLLRDLAAAPRWHDRLASVAGRPGSHNPQTYLEALAALGCAVDAWETTYLHVLPGADAVLTWVSGTALRPVLAALRDAEREEFLSEYAPLLRQAYPRRSYGTVLPFRRIFVVARLIEEN